jgi:hypothetical protein
MQLNFSASGCGTPIALQRKLITEEMKTENITIKYLNKNKKNHQAALRFCRRLNQTGIKLMGRLNLKLAF